MLWFWTVDGPKDDDSAETWRLKVDQPRELAISRRKPRRPPCSLRMAEDALLGSADSAVRLVHDIRHPSVGLDPNLGNLFRLHRDVEAFGDAVEKTLPVDELLAREGLPPRHRPDDRRRDGGPRPRCTRGR